MITPLDPKLKDKPTAERLRHLAHHNQFMLTPLQDVTGTMTDAANELDELKNILARVKNIADDLGPVVGDRIKTVLPPEHMVEKDDAIYLTPEEFDKLQELLNQPPQRNENMAALLKAKAPWDDQ